MSSSSSSKAKTAPKESDPSKDVLAKALPSPISPPKVVQQANAVEKEKEMAKEVALEITKPLTIPKDSLKEKVTSQSRKIVLATFPIPTKDGFKGRGLAIFSSCA